MPNSNIPTYHQCVEGLARHYEQDPHIRTVERLAGEDLIDDIIDLIQMRQLTKIKDEVEELLRNLDPGESIDDIFNQLRNHINRVEEDMHIDLNEPEGICHGRTKSDEPNKSNKPRHFDVKVGNGLMQGGGS